LDRVQTAHANIHIGGTFAVEEESKYIFDVFMFPVLYEFQTIYSRDEASPRIERIHFDPKKLVSIEYHSLNSGVLTNRKDSGNHNV
jgi:hypothetical protein